MTRARVRGYNRGVATSGGSAFGLVGGRLLLALVFTGVMLEPSNLEEGGWTVAAALVFAAATVVGYVVREVGHAVAAAVVGLEVIEIRIGVGRNLMRSRIGGLEVWWNAIPIGACTIVGGRVTRYARLRYWLVVAAGPCASVALGVAALIAGFAIDDRPRPDGLQPLLLFGFANLLIALAALLPLGNRAGALLLRLPFQRDLGPELAASMYLIRAERARRDRDLDRALAVLDEGVAAVPGRWELLNAVALVHLDRGELDEAERRFRALLDRDDLQPIDRAAAENNLAWIDLVNGGAEAIAEADTLSASALRAFPQSPAICSTRGAVLVELGHVDDGARLLRQALAVNHEPRARSYNAASLAIAEARRGDAAAAREYLALACALDATHELMPRAEAAVAALGRR